MEKKPVVGRLVDSLLLGLVLVSFFGYTGACCAQRSDTPTSGLRGTIMKGPMCPGPARRDRPCPNVPVTGAFQVLDGAGGVVATFRSDEAGHFSLELPAGEFTVVPEGQGIHRNSLGGSSRVTVRKGEVTEVSLHWDTGMR